MKIIKYSILPVILLISMVICLFNYSDISKLDNYSFTNTLIVMSEYGETDNYTKYVSRIRSDIDNLRNYINHSPMYENIVEPSQEDTNLTFIEKVTNAFRNAFNSLTTFLSNVSNNNNAFISTIGTFGYYITALFPMGITLISLSFDSIGITLDFLGFAFNLFFI